MHHHALGIARIGLNLVLAIVTPVPGSIGVSGPVVIATYVHFIKTVIVRAVKIASGGWAGIGLGSESANVVESEFDVEG